MFLKYKKVTLYSFDECQIYLVKYFYLMFLAHCKTQTCNKKAFKLKSNNSVTLHLNVKPPNFELQLTIKKKALQSNHEAFDQTWLHKRTS